MYDLYMQYNLYSFMQKLCLEFAASHFIGMYMNAYSWIPGWNQQQISCIDLGRSIDSYTMFHHQAILKW